MGQGSDLTQKRFITFCKDDVADLTRFLKKPSTEIFRTLGGNDGFPGFCLVSYGQFSKIAN
jgi:hypothetical protein